jgi:hypothetical protein
MPGVTTEQLEDVIRVLSGVAPLNDSTEHAVSEELSPVPVKVTVVSSAALDGNSVKVAAPRLTVSTACAKSPALGAQPLLPEQAVISITYSPAGTSPMMKLPVTIPVPTVIAHADEPARTGLGVLVLLIEHD